MKLCLPLIAFSVLLSSIWLAAPLHGEETAQQVDAQLPALIAALDSPHFVVRQRATERLSSYADRPELAQTLSNHFADAMLSTELSFEARSRLEPLVRRLPAPTIVRSISTSSAQLEKLLDQMEDDSAAIRAGAAVQLNVLAEQSSSNADVMAALGKRLARAEPGGAIRQQLAELLDRARGVWLLSEPATWRMPAVSDEQIQELVELLCAPAKQDRKSLAAQQAAQRQLIDLLARDEEVLRVKSVLEARLADKEIDLDAVKRLEAILDWTKPAMVAEYWEGAEDRPGVEHRSIQYILIDVPSVPEGGIRATHFDRIDEKTAHCVSGNSLSPGDYPVGVFFPHPQQGGAQFHLINLPTPRRRLAYEFQVRVDDRIRSREITRRTLDRLLELKKPLSQSEILMLEELDEGPVSAFAGTYFLQVDDSRYPPPEAQFVGNLSRHLNFCCMLARSGRHEAIAGLMQAIQAKRFLDPPAETPYEWPWVAILCITVHDPWPEVDSFLAGLIERQQPLMQARARAPSASAVGAEQTDMAPEPKVPEIGATAGAILLTRHGIPPSVFGLEVLMYSPLVSLDCPGAYFRDPKDRGRVLDWWRKHKTQPSARGSA